MKANLKNIILLLVVVVSVVLGVSFFNRNLNKTEAPVYTDILEMFERDQVVSFELDSKLNLTMKVLKLVTDASGNPILDENGNYTYETKDGKKIRVSKKSDKKFD